MAISLFLVFQAKLRKHMIKLLISLKQSCIFVVFVLLVSICFEPTGEVLFCVFELLCILKNFNHCEKLGDAAISQLL